MDTLKKIMVFLWETSSSFCRVYGASCRECSIDSFFIQLSKRETRLPISPTSPTKLGRSHVKKFHTIIYFIQHCGENSSHQLGYHGLADWFHITIEPDVNHE
jgi:hypothetical protein